MTDVEELRAALLEIATELPPSGLGDMPDYIQERIARVGVLGATTNRVELVRAAALGVEAVNQLREAILNLLASAQHIRAYAEGL